MYVEAYIWTSCRCYVGLYWSYTSFLVCKKKFDGHFYLGGYIEVAKKRRLLEGYDYDEVYKMLKPNGEVNRKDIINKVKEKWGYKFSRFM